MGYSDKYVGLLKTIQFERYKNIYGILSAAISSGTTKTAASIEAYSGVELPRNSKIQLCVPYRYKSITLTLSSALETGDTLINFDSVTFNDDFPAGSSFARLNDSIENKYKRFFVEHIHMFEQGSTHGNDLLINSFEPGGGKYNHNSGNILAAGQNYNNNWGTKFSVMNVPSFKCKLERIIVRCGSNGTSNEDWKISLWEKPVNNNSTSASALALIDDFDITCQNNQSYVHHFEEYINYDLTEGAAIIPSFAKTGSVKRNSTRHYADITLIFSYNDA